MLIHTSGSMSIEIAGAKNLLIRRVPRNANAPPVPPKSFDLTASTHGRGQTRLKSIGDQKPLPSRPSQFQTSQIESDHLSKPLPQPPKMFSVKTTLLWIVGFCLWFLVIVTILPIILEKDVMPGFNRWLRGSWH
jgi:hypothetical protein